MKINKQKSLIIFVFICVLPISCTHKNESQINSQNESKLKSSEIRGPYLGMKPPEDLPELFAPGIVSSIFWEHSGAVFSPDGQRLYYFSSEGEENENAWVIDKTEDGWGEPRLLRISDGDNEGIKVNEIHEARSGNLYFDSTIDVKSGQTNFRTQARDPNISSVQTLKYLLVN